MNKNKGFMIYEMIIIIVIIAIIAAIAIPGLLRARTSANEGSASAALRSITSAQYTFSKSASVDQDNDGTGEFGLFGELTGATGRRSAEGQRPPLSVSDLSMSLAPTPAGHSQKSGYCYRMFLPGPIGRIVTDSDKVTSLDATKPKEDDAIQNQENRFICYAWPLTYRSSGVRVFVVDQSAEVFAASNTGRSGEGVWEGTMRMPEYKDAMSKSQKVDETNWANIAVKGGAYNSEQTWLPSY